MEDVYFVCVHTILYMCAHYITQICVHTILYICVYDRILNTMEDVSVLVFSLDYALRLFAAVSICNVQICVHAILHICVFFPFLPRLCAPLVGGGTLQHVGVHMYIHICVETWHTCVQI